MQRFFPSAPAQRLSPALAALALFAAQIVLATMALGAKPSSTNLLRQAKSWGYQLQDIKIGPLHRSTYDVLVIDAGAPAPGSEFSRRALKRLKKKPDGSRRLVLAYMNIGEAEDYRYYWKKRWAKHPPAWMGKENCHWKGDHRARFWMPEWQKILLGGKRSYLARIIDMGFDGIYLDRVDIYRYWLHEKPDAFKTMVAFVRKLSAWAKARKPGFLIVPQNGEGLLADASYRAAIDGQAKEDLIYGDHGNGVPNARWRYVKARDLILKARKDGLPVFAIEYLRKDDKIAAANATFKDLGFVPYYGPRSLSRLGVDNLYHPEDGRTEPLLDEMKGKDGC